MVERANAPKTAADRFTVEEFLDWAAEHGGRYEPRCGRRARDALGLALGITAMFVAPPAGDAEGAL